MPKNRIKLSYQYKSKFVFGWTGYELQKGKKKISLQFVQFHLNISRLASYSKATYVGILEQQYQKSVFPKYRKKLHQEIKYLLVRLLLLRCPRWLINSANNAKRSRLFLYNHRFNHSRSSTFRIKLFEVVRMPDNLGILTEAALILLFSYPYFA